MELLDKLQWRYAAKAMNVKKVSDEKVEKNFRSCRLPLLLAVYNHSEILW